MVTKLLFVGHCLTIAVLLMPSTANDQMLGRGTYKLISINQCPDSENNAFTIIDIQRRKVNRTHDGFNATLHLAKVLDDTYGVRTEMSKKMDGGYKLMHYLQEDSFTKALQRFANNNTKNFLTMAGINPPEFPLNPGTLEVTNYVVDFEELPDTGVFGSYAVHTVILEALEQIVGCVDFIIDFNAEE